MCRNRRWRRTPWRPKVRPRYPQGQTIAGNRARELIIWNLVRRLSEAVSQVRDEQGYIVVRERVHRNTAESTNGRVKWWSTFQLAVVIGEGVFQVWWLKRFFEVSRVRMRMKDRMLMRFSLFTGQARCLNLPYSFPSRTSKKKNMI